MKGIAQMNKLKVTAEALKNTSFFEISLYDRFQKSLNVCTLYRFGYPLKILVNCIYFQTAIPVSHYYSLYIKVITFSNVQKTYSATIV